MKRGQALLEVETDKAVQEVECIANGTLKTIHVQSGQKVPVGTDHRDDQGELTWSALRTQVSA